MNFNKIWSHLRACAHCHLWLGQTDLFCPTCWNLVFKNRIWKKIDEYSLETKSLFCWRQEDAILGELIYSLKGGDLADANDRLARSILTSVESHELTDVAFVPAPSKNLEQPDHAYMIAKSLSNLSGRPLIKALQRVDEDSQKQLNRSERLRSKLALNAGFSIEQGRIQSIIFIDDVVTTGATAHAAHLALGKPKNFKVWTIAYRPRLAWTAPL